MMNDLVATLDVETIVIEDIEISKNIDKNFKVNIQNELKINMFRKDKMWVLAGDKQNC